MNKILLKTFSDEKLDEIIKCGFEEFKIDKKLTIVKKIFIKPNLSTDESILISGANTDIRIIKGILRYLKKYPNLEVVLGESESVGRDVERAFRIMNLKELEKEFNVKVKNLTKEERFKILIPEGKFLNEVFLSRSLVEADLIINLPKIKTHRYTTITSALKNMFGSIPDPLRIRYHKNIHQTIADLNMLFQGKIFNITDGIMGMEGEGPLSGHKLKLSLVVFSDNSVVNDLIVAKIMRIPFKDIIHLVLANDWAQIEPGQIEIAGDLRLDDVSRVFARPTQNWLVKLECQAVRCSFMGNIFYNKIGRFLLYSSKKYKAKYNKSL